MMVKMRPNGNLCYNSQHMNKTTVLIIDDHAILRMGLASLLNAKKGIEVIGDAANGKTGIQKALKLHPDVIIMDLMMPGMDGAETTQQLIAKNPDCKILILTTFGTSDGITLALEAGAMGAIMKNCDFGELVTAIRTIAKGERYISPDVRCVISKDPPIAQLSPRQSEILQSIVRGLSNPDIAKQLGISLDMVKEHTAALFQKLGAANRPEAVAIALKKHLLKI